MKAATLTLLRCPLTGSKLSLHPGFPVVMNDNRIAEGVLRNDMGTQLYPIVRTVPILCLLDHENGRRPATIPNEDFVSDAVKDWYTSTAASAAVNKEHGRLNDWDQFAEVYLDLHFGLEIPFQGVPEGIARATWLSARTDLYQQLCSLVTDHKLDHSIVLDLGCGPGRMVFELARMAQCAIGIDRSYAMLRRAVQIRDGNHHHLTYRRPYEGSVSVERTADVSRFVGSDAEFILADAQRVPLARNSASLVLSVNLVDAVSDPLCHLKEIAALCRDSSACLLASPYSWGTVSSANASEWLTTESGQPSRDRILREMGHYGFVRAAMLEDIPWSILWDRRALSVYSVECLLLTR